MSPRLWMKNERRLALLAWITVCLVWGTTYLAIRVALESVPVALLAGLRWTAAGVLMAAALRLSGQALPGPKAWPSLALVGFLMSVIGNGLVVWAEQYVASGLAAVVVAMVPFWSVGIEAVLPRGERLTARTLIGLALGFTGIVVLVWPELTTSGAGSMFVFGILALQLACLGWALGTSFTKRYAKGHNPLVSSAMQMIFGGLILTAIGTATGEWDRLVFTERTAAAMIYLVIFGSIVGYSAYVYALGHLPVSTVSLYAYVNPIIAVVLGTLLLSEPFDARIVFAAAMVLAGIAVVRSNRPPAAKQVESNASTRKAVA
jgi:drug/metabolite transporter (DMT)-like permease